ncbi:MAG: DUF2723 domain-containing protein [Candidatus Eiseniibacteriota bacterium]|jgi:hypothetical protein
MSHTDWSEPESHPVPAPRPGLLTFGVALLLAALMLALYVVTLAPGVGWGPEAALQQAAVLGELGGGASDHPLFVAAAHLVERLPVASTVAARVNLTAALCGALIVLIVFLGVLALLDRARLGGAPRLRLLFAATGAIALGLGHSLWLRSVTASPAALAGLCFVLVIWLWMRRLLGGGGYNVLLGALLLGLSLAADIGLVVLVPFFLVGGLWLLWRPPVPPPSTRGRFRRGRTVLSTEPPGGPAGESSGRESDQETAGSMTGATGGAWSPRTEPEPLGARVTATTAPRRRPSFLAALVALGVAFSIGLAPLAVLEVVELVRTPLAPDFASEVLPGHAGPVRATVAHVATRAVEGSLLPPVPAAAYGERATQLLAVVLYNFFLVATLLGVIGALTLLVRRGTIAVAVMLLVVFAVMAGSVVALPAPDLAGALLPAAIVFAIWVGCGAAAVGRFGRPWTALVCALLVVASPLAAYLGLPAVGTDRAEIGSLAGWVAPPIAAQAPATRLVPWRQGREAPGRLATAYLEAAGDDAALVIQEGTGRGLYEAVRYVQRVEGRGPGVWLYHRDAGDSTSRTLEQVLLRHGRERPVFLALADTTGGWSDVALLAGGVRAMLVPRGPLYEVIPAGTPVRGTVPARQPQRQPAATDRRAGQTASAGLGVRAGVGLPDTTAGTASADTVATHPMTGTTPADTAAAQPMTGTAPADTAAAQPMTGTAPADTAAAQPMTGTAPADTAAAHPTTGHPARADTVAPAWQRRVRQQAVRSAADTTFAARLAAARLAIDAGAPEQATAILESLVDVRPHDAEVYYLLGRARAAAGDEAAARNNLRRAIALDPRHVPALAALGDALLAAGDSTAAGHVYRRLLQLEPEGQRAAEIARLLEALETTRPAAPE